MRADRRKEIEKQMANGSPKGTGKVNVLYIVVSVLYLLAAAAFLFFVFKLNVVPAKFLVAGIAVLAIITLFTVPVMLNKKGKRTRKTISAVIALILVMCFGVGIYYMASTNDFLESITSRRTVVTEDFHVLVRAEDNPMLSPGDTAEADASQADVTEVDASAPDTAEADASQTDASVEEAAEDSGASADAEPEEEAERVEVDDETVIGILSGQTVGTFASNDQMYSKAKIMLQEFVGVDYSYDETLNSCVDKLLAKEHDAILIPAASYEAMKSQEGYNIEQDTFILYTVKVPKETADRTKSVDVTKECFNVYISGADEGGIRSDVNMIATVNPKKHEVLLTSIPRDFYLTLPSKEAKDKLTHAGLYGIEELMGALENEFGITLNYYVKVNYKALRGVVDAIGGIDVESQYDFTTSGMGRLNGSHFVVGVNHLDGDLALAFCRERHSFMSGDMTRNENQQAVLEAIIAKATSSTTILTSYTSVLDAVSGNLETDMSADEMSALVKMQMKDMPGWNIRKNAIKGTTGSDYCYSLGNYASVVYSLPDEVTKAVDEIVKTEMMENTENIGNTETAENTENTEEPAE